MIRSGSLSFAPGDDLLRSSTDAQAPASRPRSTATAVRCCTPRPSSRGRRLLLGDGAHAAGPRDLRCARSAARRPGRWPRHAARCRCGSASSARWPPPPAASTSGWRPRLSQAAAASATRRLILGGAVSTVDGDDAHLRELHRAQGQRAARPTLPAASPSGGATSIVPVAFALICVRFIWRAPGKLAGAERHRLARRRASILALVQSAPTRRTRFLVAGRLLIAVAFVARRAGLRGHERRWRCCSSSPPTIRRRSRRCRTRRCSLVQNPTLPAIPLLTLAGYVLAAGGASQRLVRAYKSLFGWMPGGLALMAICVMRALHHLHRRLAASPSSRSAASCLPALVKRQVPRGLLARPRHRAGLARPALPAVAAGDPLRRRRRRRRRALFLAGLVPGILLIVVVAAYAIRARHQGPGAAPALRRARGSTRALWAAKFDLGLPVVVHRRLPIGLADHRRGGGDRRALRPRRRAARLPRRPPVEARCRACSCSRRRWSARS